MTGSKETTNHGVFTDSIAFAYSVILSHDMMHTKDVHVFVF